MCQHPKFLDRQGSYATPSGPLLGAVARLIFLGIVGVMLVAWPSRSHAHGGGTAQLTDTPVGPYRLYVWTDPEPWREGEVHVSMIVTLPADTAQPSDDNALTNALETPVADVAITLALTPLERPDAPLTVVAEQQDVLNNVYFEADVELPMSGKWQTSIHVDGPQGAGDARFQIDVLPARSIAWPWFGLALATLAVGLIGIRLWSNKKGAPDADRPSRRRVRRLKEIDGDIQEAL